MNGNFIGDILAGKWKVNTRTGFTGRIKVGQVKDKTDKRGRGRVGALKEEAAGWREDRGACEAGMEWGAKEIKGSREEGGRACNQEKDVERSRGVCMSHKLPPVQLKREWWMTASQKRTVYRTEISREGESLYCDECVWLKCVLLSFLMMLTSLLHAGSLSQ